MGEEVDQDDLAYKIHVLEQLMQQMMMLQEDLDGHLLIDESSHLDNIREEVFKAKRLLIRVESRTATIPAQTQVQVVSKQLKVSDVKLTVYSGDLL